MSEPLVGQNDLATLETMLANHNWQYGQSDDPADWIRSRDELAAIINLMEILAKAGAGVEARALYTKYCEYAV